MVERVWWNECGGTSVVERVWWNECGGTSALETPTPGIAEGVFDSSFVQIDPVSGLDLTQLALELGAFIGVALGAFIGVALGAFIGVEKTLFYASSRYDVAPERRY